MDALVANYDPLEITVVRGRGSYVYDADGTAYLDCIAGYSALSFGHSHPGLLAAAHTQLDRLTLTSRAVRNDLLRPFAEAVCALTGYEQFLPMNTGAEAVETMIKAARKWGYETKGVAKESAEIIVAAGGFHGRTTTIVSFSTDPDARDGFGPYTPGFVTVPYGDAAAAAAAITENTVGILVEPIQGEAGIIIPPPGYLRELRRACDDAGVLLMCDEIQSGLGRTGATLCQDHEGVRADLTALGKALSGGLMPISGVVGAAEVLSVLRAGTHGSTFGGNPLACAIGLAVTGLLATGELQERAARLGPGFGARARALEDEGLLTGVRSKGLWLGVDVASESGRAVSVALAARGVLAKETHGRTIRFAPPLNASEAELDAAMDALGVVLRAA